ncbi:hypothetical protein IX39_17460 [Chryseobacterium formosense]|uniref:Uncharacterized protein n=1 Tax=Chryseobacterium formosense TaxID=236814 RepID=A0A085Z164_9FLAO|nr:hypothetical protein IX39_17460 [Chryseobacterium formosense]
MGYLKFEVRDSRFEIIEAEVKVLLKISYSDFLAARLERSSFCCSEAEAKKRERKAEIAAQININNV